MKRFMGLFLVAADGSETALPNLPQLCEEFGGTGRSLHHLEEVGKLLPLKETLFIFDRGYPSKNFILELNQKTNCTGCIFRIF